MNGLSLKDLELVGFNGAPLVECGRALPIVRRKSDGAHAVLDFSNGVTALNWHSESEAASFLTSGRWTKFAAPVLVPRACCDGTSDCITDQPMVIYADESMLDTADRLPRPTTLSEEHITWRRLESHGESNQAACASAATVESLLDDWAAALLKRFDAMYRMGRDRADLKRVADFALCAARRKDLRWRAFSYYATVQSPERVRRTFDTFTQREFPGANWDDFMKQVRSLGDVLVHAPALNGESRPLSSAPSSAQPTMWGRFVPSLDDFMPIVLFIIAPLLPLLIGCIWLHRWITGDRDTPPYRRWGIREWLRRWFIKRRPTGDAA